MANAFYHLCVCVSDLERSLKFYCDGLGFVRNESFTIGSAMAPLVQMEGEVALNSVYLGMSGVRLELWHFDAPAAQKLPPRPMNTIGLTHIAVRVDDMDAAIKRAEEYGGTYLPKTRTRASTDGLQSDICYILDPDGVRIELLWMPEGTGLTLTP
jgi:glyoxylase I family protein